MRIVLLATLLFFCLVRSASGIQNAEGLWEGIIEDPRRPVVLTVDFNANTFSFSGGAFAKMSKSSVAVNQTVNFEVFNGQRTLTFTGIRSGNRITGEMNNGNRVTPFWLELLPVLPKPANRVEAWQQDIDVVLSRFLR